MYVAIIGGKNSGKTTFVSLLYATQINYTEETEGRFRFITQPNVLKILGYQYNCLRAGKWPKKKVWNEISFSFGFEDKSLGGRFKKIFGKDQDRGRIELKFGLYELNTEPDPVQTKSKKIPLITEPSKLDQLVTSKIIVILIDVSKLGMDKKNDEHLSKILNRSTKSIHTKVHPIIIYTKFDIVKKQKLKKAKLSTESPGTWQESFRGEYGNKLIKKYYPKLYNSIKGLELDYYYVFLNVETNSKGKKIPKLSNDTEIELDYSYHEYYKFIDQLGKISQDLS
jgi:hypothetical protein